MEAGWRARAQRVGGKERANRYIAWAVVLELLGIGSTAPRMTDSSALQCLQRFEGTSLLLRCSSDSGCGFWGTVDRVICGSSTQLMH